MDNQTIESVDKNLCTGCKMCGDACPTSAIIFENNKKGFWYPKVDAKKCVKCKKCLNLCPAVLEINQASREQPKVYAGWSNDDSNRLESTSGGIFYEIAKLFIKQGGVVVGSRYSKDWKSAEHSIAYNIEQLEKLRGSKYFQSDTAKIYKDTLKELKGNKKVLFCGSPCQIAALKSYLGKDYGNLYCLDFICRSINSPKAFEAYISDLEKKHNSKTVNVRLKDKTLGWQSLASKVTFENGEVSLKDKNNDLWVKGFIYSDLYTRDSCFNCKYRTIPRQNSDLTIGDFWGIKGPSKDNFFKGISCLLVNTPKGEMLIDNIKDNITLIEKRLDDVLAGNPALVKNPKRNNSDKFFTLLESTNSFEIAIKKCLPNNSLKKYLIIVKKIFKKVINAMSYFINHGSVWKFIYYNYICKNVIRHGNGKILPSKGAVIELSDKSQLHLYGSNNLILGYDSIKGSRAETYIRMTGDAVWHCRNGAGLFNYAVVEVKDKAVLDTGYFTANGGSVIIADKSITLGEDVMIGRNVIIYDSDFHTIYNKAGLPINAPKPVVIEDHVWLTSNITVLKGVTIGKGCLVTAQTVVNKTTPQHSIIAASAIGKAIKDEVSWDRARCVKD